jgi:hypothetical protein
MYGDVIKTDQLGTQGVKAFLVLKTKQNIVIPAGFCRDSSLLNGRDQGYSLPTGTLIRR